MSETQKTPVPESVSDLVRRTVRQLDEVRLLEEEEAHVRASRMKTVLESTEQALDAASGHPQKESDLSREAAQAARKLHL